MLTIFFLLLSCTNLVKLPPINNIYSGTIKIPIIGTQYVEYKRIAELESEIRMKGIVNDIGFINYNKVENDLYSYELNDKLIKILNKYKISLRDPKYNSFNDSASIEIVINIIRFNKIVNLYNKNNCYLT